jgi:hypothetical protein
MRTVIMADRNQTIDPHDLERFGTTTLVGLPSSAAKKRPSLSGKLRPKLKSAGGGSGTISDVGSRPVPLKFSVMGGPFQLAASVLSTTVSLDFLCFTSRNRPPSIRLARWLHTVLNRDSG